MHINIESEPLAEARLLCDVEAEVPVEGDITIPDYKAEVFRILKAMGEPVVLQKPMSGAKLAVEGYIKLTVLYSGGEDGRVHSVFQKLPFSKQLDLKAPAADNCRVMVQGDMAYLNCRAVNSRRLDVRGAARLRIFALDAVPEQCAVDIAGSGVHQKMLPITCFAPSMLAEKRFSLNETLETQHPILGEASILSCDRTIDISSVERSGTDVIAAGNVDIDLATVDESGGIHRDTYHIPFRQLIDCSAAEDDAVSVAGSIVATGFDGDGSGKNLLDISVGCVLSCWVLKKQRGEYVADCFSTKYESTPELETVSLIDGIMSIRENFESEASAGGAADSKAEILDAFAVLGAPDVLQREGAAHVLVKGQAVAVLRDAEGVRTLETPFECQVPLGAGFDFSAYEISARASAVTASAEGGGVRIRIKGKVQGVVAGVRGRTILKDLTLLEDKPKSRPEHSLVMVFSDNSDMWELAKRYNTSPELIAAENPEPGSAPLLIPISD